MKLDPSIHIAMHSVLSLKPVVTLEPNSLHGMGPSYAQPVIGELRVTRQEEGRASVDCMRKAHRIPRIPLTNKDADDRAVDVL